MAAGELADDATHEDIVAYVDKVVEETSLDEPEKGDSQKVAEDHDETPIAETNTGDDDSAEAESQGEETGDSEPADAESADAESADAEWLDDDLKAETAAYGISEEELADFTSREEVERALRFFDRSALEAGRKAISEEKDSAPEETVKPEVPTGQYEINLDRDVYDEGLVDEITNMRDHYESRLGALESRFEEINTSAEEQKFDSLVDSLGHSDLFGKSGKENSKQLQRRQDLFVAAKAQQIGLQQLGREVDLNESLVNRVARMVFAEDLGKKDLKARTRRMSKQSDSRQGGSATKAHDQKEPLMDEMERLYKELEGA